VSKEEMVFCGIRVHVDPSVPPEEVRMASLMFNHLTQRLEIFDQVRLVNVRTHAASMRKGK
jgi:hypothetical protein